MNIKNSTLFIISLFLFACTPDYQTTTAIITKLETLPNFNEEGNYRAEYEYSVDGLTYSDHFEINLMTLVNDSIATPAPGTEFEILYNPANPAQNKAVFNEKTKYIEPDYKN